MQDPISNASPDVEAAIQKILAAEKGLPSEDPSPMLQENFLSGYSIAALVFGPIYFAAQKDSKYTWYSILGAIIFFPVLLWFPLQARRRAWKSRQWFSFNEFERVQRQWDKAGWYCLVLTVVLGYFTLRSITGFFLNSIHSQGLDLNQVQQEIKDLQ